MLGQSVTNSVPNPTFSGSVWVRLAVEPDSHAWGKHPPNTAQAQNAFLTHLAADRTFNRRIVLPDTFQPSEPLPEPLATAHQPFGHAFILDYRTVQSLSPNQAMYDRKEEGRQSLWWILRDNDPMVVNRCDQSLAGDIRSKLGYRTFVTTTCEPD